RPQPRNLSQKLMSRMLLAFGQQLPPDLSAQVQQNIQLLVEPLSATTHSRLGQLFQPSVTVADRIDLVTAAGDRPASIESLEPVHHSRAIFGDRKIAPGQFPQRPNSRLAVVHRRE